MGGVGSLLHLGDFQDRLLQVVKNQLLAVPGPQPDRLGGFVSHHIGIRHGLFDHLVTIHGDIGQNGPAVCAGGHIIVIVEMDALDLKDGAGNDLLGLGVPLEDGEAGQLLVRRCDGDCAAAVDGGLIHMGNHRLGEGGEG